MRIRPSVLKSIADPRIRALLPALRTPEACARELRWICAEKGSQPSKVARICKLRGKGVPLQYLLGSQPFGPLDILCRRKVLIPRWETEEWVLTLAKTINSSTSVLDICTGTGCISFLLEKLTGTPVLACDISPHAEKVFLLNQKHLGLLSSFFRHDMYSPLPNIAADLVVANPPYIPKLTDADISVSLYEPRLALVGDLPVYKALIDRVLECGASAAVFEVGSPEQIDYCCDLFAAHGWEAHGRLDGAGNPRTVWAKKPNCDLNWGNLSLEKY